MSWYPDDPGPFQNPIHANGDRRPRRKGQAKAKAMINPDDLQKIALLLVAGSSAAICIFTMRIIVASFGG